MAGVRQPKIIMTHTWGSKPATAPPVVTGRPKRIIFHHTAGHHPEIENPQNESRAEAMRFARSIQAFHMGPERNFNDSGHNMASRRRAAATRNRSTATPSGSRT